MLNKVPTRNEVGTVDLANAILAMIEQKANVGTRNREVAGLRVLPRHETSWPVFSYGFLSLERALPSPFYFQNGPSL